MRLYIQKIEGKFEVGIDTTQEQYEEFNELQGICDRLNSENKEEIKKPDNDSSCDEVVTKAKIGTRWTDPNTKKVYAAIKGIKESSCEGCDLNDEVGCEKVFCNTRIIWKEVKEKKLGAKKDFGIIKQSLADSLKEYLSHKDTKGKKAVIKVIDAICGEKEKKSKVKPKVHGCGSLGDFSACGKNGITTTSTADVTCKLCLRAMKARGIL